MNKRFNARRVALCGLLLAMMLILGWVEKQIPLPHGFKLGLSNSVLIFAVYMLDIPTAIVLMVLKVLLSNLLFGNFGITFAMGFAGGALSLAVMILLSRIKGIHPVTVSLFGSAMHIVGQLLMAQLVSNIPGLMNLMPMMLLFSLACGALTGVCASLVMKHLRHMRF